MNTPLIVDPPLNLFAPADPSPYITFTAAPKAVEPRDYLPETNALLLLCILLVLIVRR